MFNGCTICTGVKRFRRHTHYAVFVCVFYVWHFHTSYVYQTFSRTLTPLPSKHILCFSSWVPLFKASPLPLIPVLPSLISNLSQLSRFSLFLSENFAEYVGQTVPLFSLYIKSIACLCYSSCNMYQHKAFLVLFTLHMLPFHLFFFLLY